MAGAKTLKQAIMQAVVEASQAAGKVINEESRKQTIGPGHHNAKEAVRPQSGGASLRQLLLDWNARQYIYQKIEMRVKKKIINRNFELNHVENVPVIKNWLGKDDLQFIQILKVVEQETSHTVKRLFDTVLKNSDHSI